MCNFLLQAARASLHDSHLLAFVMEVQCAFCWVRNESFIQPSTTGFYNGHILCFLGSELIFNPLNAELNPICHLLALLWAQHILHISRISIKCAVWHCIQWSLESLLLTLPSQPMPKPSFAHGLFHLPHRPNLLWSGHDPFRLLPRRARQQDRLTVTFSLTGLQRVDPSLNP